MLNDQNVWNDPRKRVDVNEYQGVEVWVYVDKGQWRKEKEKEDAVHQTSE